MDTSHDPAKARASLAAFLVLTLGVSAVIEAAALRAKEGIESQPALIVALMWTPGLASMLVRLLRREGIADVSFRFGGRATARAMALVCLYPVFVGAVAYGLGWASGLAAFEPPDETMGLHPSSRAGRFALRLLFTMLPGIPLGMITALGEEIGWRGFFVQRLVAAGWPRPLLLSGLVWGAWHMPLILSGQYAAGPWPALSALVFLVTVVAAGYLFGWARLTTGSVWPAVVGHAAWNSILQGTFDASSKGPAAVVWVGESGVLVAAVSVVTVALLLRGPFAVRLRPGSEPVDTLALTASSGGRPA